MKLIAKRNSLAKINFKQLRKLVAKVCQTEPNTRLLNIYAPMGYY